jgi:hypothetical protein
VHRQTIPFPLITIFCHLTPINLWRLSSILNCLKTVFLVRQCHIVTRDANSISEIYGKSLKKLCIIYKAYSLQK